MSALARSAPVRKSTAPFLNIPSPDSPQAHTSRQHTAQLEMVLKKARISPRISGTISHHKSLFFVIDTSHHTSQITFFPFNYYFIR
jgi:hypothetical protein